MRLLVPRIPGAYLTMDALAVRLAVPPSGLLETFTPKQTLHAGRT
jgi:hypothetical protein